MQVNFVSLGETHLASHRFRVLKPYELLNQQQENKVTIKKFPDFDADINIYQKHLFPNQIIEWMSKIPTKKIFDVCDDHFDRELKDYYKTACSLADVLTCTNERMEKRLKELFPDKRVVVCYDPINTIEGSPRVSEKPKLIWFGHSTNFEDALPWLREAVELNYDLTVVSNLNIKGGDFKFIPFKEGWVEDNLKNYDIVLLPTGMSLKQPWVNMKSENRFVDALNAGCCVITNNDVLYKDLVKYGIYETGSLGKALEEYKKFKIQKIESGQKFIQEKYSDEVIKEQWNQAVI